LRFEDKLYWSRFLGGALMGLLTEILKLYRPTIVLAIVIAALVYIASSIILRSLIPVEKRAKLGRKLYLSGAGAYAVTWLITLILSFNLLKAPLAS